ncbi:MAG: amidohydrolase family protein [Deltaproteobacteria bacterium]|nr:amidohydrolase family protein [Deltaproteobacteria bacterium]
MIINCKWIFDGDTLHKDKAIYTKSGEIASLRLLKKFYPEAHTIERDGLCLPAFVNVHTHIELSYLKGKLPRGKGFLPWLKYMIALKKMPVSNKKILNEAISAINTLKKSGVVYIGDVSNTLSCRELIEKNFVGGAIFIEIYGKKHIPTSEQKKHFPLCISPHAIYSTSPNLLLKISNTHKKTANPLSIHVAESEEECRFVKKEGKMYDFLKMMGFLKDLPSAKTPVQYLDRLHIIDKNTILVHCVHITDEDINIIENRNASIALCLRSNDYIGGGFPPMEKLIKNNINISIGTDSLASVNDMDFLKEIQFVFKKFPFIDPKLILSWATYGGMKALKINPHFSYPNFIPIESNEPLEEMLTESTKIYPLSSILVENHLQSPLP